MQIVKQSVTLIPDKGVTELEKIEKVGRTCYKSNDKIADGSAVKFVKALAKSKHYAMLEHAEIYITTTMEAKTLNNVINNAFEAVYGVSNPTKFLNVTYVDDIAFVSGSFRAFIEAFEVIVKADNLDTCDRYDLVVALLKKLSDKWPDLFESFYTSIVVNPEDIETSYCKTLQDMIYIVEKDEFIRDIREYVVNDNIDAIISKHVKHTLLFVTDRGVSHEFVRHRPASFAQESTRYCNYAKDKFGGEISVIEPVFIVDESVDKDILFRIWKDACENAEGSYFELLNEGVRPQDARGVLPTDLKTELIITATEAEWQHILNLRLHGTTGAPHPKMHQVMAIAQPILIEQSEGRLQ